jgi:hypothetical protein
MDHFAHPPPHFECSFFLKAIITFSPGMEGIIRDLPRSRIVLKLALEYMKNGLPLRKAIQFVRHYKIRFVILKSFIFPQLFPTLFQSFQVY